MIICIDFDGVVADTCTAKRRWLQQNGLGEIVGSVSKTALEPRIGSALYAQMQACIGFEDTLLATPKDGCLSVLPKLRKIAQLHIVSARSADKLFWAKQWLFHNGLAWLFADVHSSFGGLKADTIACLGADCLIDDDSRHFFGIGLERAILFGEDQLEYGASFQRARRWADVEDLLT